MISSGGRTNITYIGRGFESPIISQPKPRLSIRVNTCGDGGGRSGKTDIISPSFLMDGGIITHPWSPKQYVYFLSLELYLYM